jgi:hypothetical protein
MATTCRLDPSIWTVTTSEETSVDPKDAVTIATGVLAVAGKMWGAGLKDHASKLDTVNGDRSGSSFILVVTGTAPFRELTCNPPLRPLPPGATIGTWTAQEGSGAGGKGHTPSQRGRRPA